MKESLDLICLSSKYEKGKYAEFDDVFYVVRCLNPKAKSSKEK